MMAESAAGSKRIIHGGDLDAARADFPGAPEPWVDLSTGINPWPYPLPAIPADSWARLPGRSAEAALREAAAACYGAPSPDCVVAAGGSQALIQILPRLRPPGTVAVLGPTYAEHAAGWAKAGHRVSEVMSLESCGGADVMVVVNPNNPDGRIVPPKTLLALADRQAARGGWLVVDEAFAEVAPHCSVAAEAGRAGLVILRSFGKFFGLAGVRLGFLLGEPALVEASRAAMGPWAVSGPALAVATAALSDAAWIAATRRRLADAAARFDAKLAGAGVRVAGGTSLFRLIDDPQAAGLYNELGRAGVLVRRFDYRQEWLRLGLPADKAAEDRVKTACGMFKNR
ncbi:threonine-phosphate decarboxylase [Azospirillum formosense]|uniref:threonine-phosphate decarboxylase n=1 Tax=Azospirillum formosense TaxID=861533 RepID=A0ABX2L3P7_9PROT|nr:threonine-phosphate decarboxylase CobD [Azospirillum formosense]MBY3753135.1 threonine-phosphate decarboxylase [Azospirillum formosense]NUB19830.1 threonine-phosphate decarboxylase [Azospirillum formosense]